MMTKDVELKKLNYLFLDKSRLRLVQIKENERGDLEYPFRPINTYGYY